MWKDFYPPRSHSPALKMLKQGNTYYIGPFGQGLFCFRRLGEACQSLCMYGSIHSMALCTKPVSPYSWRTRSAASCLPRWGSPTRWEVTDFALRAHQREKNQAAAQLCQGKVWRTRCGSQED